MLQSNDDRWPLWDHEYEDEGISIENEAEEKPQRARPETRPSIEKRLTDNRKETGKKKPNNTPKSSTADLARYVSLGTELLAGVLVGTLLAWAFNSATGYDGPWAFIIGIFIGAAAGFLNLYRAVQGMEREEERKMNGSSK